MEDGPTGCDTRHSALSTSAPTVCYLLFNVGSNFSDVDITLLGR
ncbi:hypothetical protein SynMITS9220_01780 [Synechococcus sp. MIT S9220]|nr:hypothetical protein SynMITS9220_01780 [Synechococcus sp. MIT S9220]